LGKEQEAETSLEAVHGQNTVNLTGSIESKFASD
jgi:hypothetical protein